MARKEAQSTPAPAGGKPKKVKKVRWYHQIARAYRYTAQRDKTAPWLMLGALILVTLIGLGIGLLAGQPVYWAIIGFMFGLVGAMYVLTNRFTKAQYAELEGEMGAVGAVLTGIKSGWTFSEEPVAFDAKTRDLVFRGVGRAGVVLVGEAHTGRIHKLLEAERVKVSRVARDVPVTLIEVGRGEGQVPLPKLQSHVRKLKRKLTKAEVGEVVRRLSALGAAKLPIPKGIDPMRARPNRKAMR